MADPVIPTSRRVESLGRHGTESRVAEWGDAVGLLDELEQEAQKRGLAGDESSRRKGERDTAYRARLDPALDALHAFLSELILKLKALQPRIALRYHVPGYGEIVGYVEHEYRLSDLKQPSSRELAFDFACAIATEKCPAIDVEGASRVRAVCGFFQRHHIGGLLAPRKDAAGDVVAATFRAERPHSARRAFPRGCGKRCAAHELQQFRRFRYDGEIDRAGAGRRSTLRADRPIPRPRAEHAAARGSARSVSQAAAQKVQQQEIKRRWENRISDTREVELAELRRAYTAAGKLGGLFGRVKSFGWIGGAIGRRLRGLARRAE